MYTINNPHKDLAAQYLRRFARRHNTHYQRNGNLVVLGLLFEEAPAVPGLTVVSHNGFAAYRLDEMRVPRYDLSAREIAHLATNWWA